MTKVNTLFMTKTAEKPFRAADPYIAYVRKYPPPPGLCQAMILFSCTLTFSSA